MKEIVVVGGGVAGLFLSLFLLKKNIKVHLIEKTSSLGKKFLVAGKSDLNITNDEGLESFINRYCPAQEETIRSFSKDDLTLFLKEEIGVETFVGTSGRVFPKDIKASKILNLIIKKLKDHPNFKLSLKTSLVRFDDHSIETSNGMLSDFDAAVFCLGGASWKVTGSDGQWRKTFEEAGVKTTEFQPSNCSIELELSDFFKNKVSHHHIKNVSLSCENHKVQGDIVFNGSHLEGTPIYTMSRFFRNNKEVYFNFKPDMEMKKLKNIIEKRDPKKSIASFLKSSLKLDPLLYTFWREFHDPKTINSDLLNLITHSTIPKFKLGKLDEAISTVGGVEMGEVDDHYKLKAFTRYYAIGEMLDWDTITGGYLIQGCISQAHIVSRDLS